MFEGILQPMHLILILAVALVVFGPGKLPEIGKGLGEAIRGFKKAFEEGAQSQDNRSEPAKVENQQRITDQSPPSPPSA